MSDYVLSLEPDELQGSQKNFLYLLNAYCQDILAVEKDRHLIDGAIESLRLILEMTEAYLVQYCSDHRRLVRDCHSDLTAPGENKKAGNRNDKKPQYNKHDFLGNYSGKAFLSRFEETKTKCNELVHYQEYRYQGDERWVKEKEACMQRTNRLSALLFHPESGYVRNVLLPFLTSVIRIGTEELDAYGSLKDMLAKDGLGCSQDTSEFDWADSEIKNNGTRNTCEDYWASVYLVCSREIEKTLRKNSRKDVTVYYHALNLLARRLCERAGILAVETCCEPEAASFCANDRVELEDYQQCLKKVNDSHRHDAHLATEIMSSGQFINDYLHWKNLAKVNQYRYIAGTSQNAEIQKWLESIRSCVERTYLIINVPAVLPESVRAIMQNTNEAIEKMKKEVKKKNDLSNFCVAALAVIACFLIGLTVYRYLHDLPHPGDPKPCFSESVTGYAWNETPEIVVTCGEEQLRPDSLNVLDRTSAASGLTYSVSDLNPESVRWSSDERFMRTIKDNDGAASVNQRGIALAKIQYIPCDSHGSTDQSNIHQTRLPFENGAKRYTSRYTFDSGYYLLRIQAVGAADGLVRDGLELNADSGPVTWPLLVLPDKMDISLSDENQNAAVTDSGFLTTYPGYTLSLKADTDLEINYYYRWDSEEEWRPAENAKIEVTRFSGMHILHVACAFPFLDMETEKMFPKDYAIRIAEAASGNAEIRAVFTDENGNIIPENGTVAVTPGQTIRADFYPSQGISMFTHTTYDQNGVRVYTLEETVSSLDSTVNYDHGTGPWTFEYDIIGKGYSGENDTKNRKKVSFTVYMKTKADEVDKQGNVTRKWWYTGSNWIPYAYTDYVYDENGRLTEASCWNTDGSPAYSKDGFHREQIIYHDEEHAEETWLYDLDGVTLIQGTKALQGCAGEYHVSTDEYYGRRYYNTRRELMLCPQMKNVAGYICYRDDKKNVVKEYFIGTSGEFIRSSDGYCFYLSAYDERGNETERWFYDTDEKTLADTVFGYSHAKFTYSDDPLKNRTGSVYFDQNDEPIVQPGGYVCEKKTYLEGTSNVTDVSYEDADGHPVMNTLLGYATKKTEYEDGEAVRDYYFDEHGILTNNANGCAIMERTVQSMSYGVLKKLVYLDADRNPVVPSTHDWASSESSYDHQNRLLECRYYGADGQPTETKDLNGCASKRYFYDGDSDNYSKMMFYDAEGKPCPQKGNTNYCGLSVTRDPDQPTITYSQFLDENEKPIENEDGIFLRKTTFDDQGRAVSEERFLRDYSYPTGDQVHRVEWIYRGDSENYCLMREYTEQLDDAVSMTEYEYDENGSLVARSTYDKTGKRVENEDGVWKWTHTVTEDEGTTVETDNWYDRNENPITGPAH